MAVQVIEKEDSKGSKGIERGINAAATGMIMDIVQEQQYQYPIQSAVRELCSNAVDSQGEKDRAIEILSGKATSDKYFIQRSGALYADSNWDPSYYSLDHLDTEHNDVELIYKEGTGGGRCDSFIVRDYGVGIGKGRLEGALSIGYSTKRNRKDALGSFGLGAKVGLATGADYYTITSVYNGVKHIVRVYRRKVNSMIGKLNLATEGMNIPYTFSNGEVIYGETTTERNYTEVSIPVLKHHKDSYIRGVETQLLYFKNVRFYLEDANDYKYEHHFKAETLHNSSNLIISANSPYSKPHVVIIKGGGDVETQTGVCYGAIEFREMELPELSGDIGVKCPIRQVYTNDDGDEVVLNEGVDVNPSRETIRYTPATTQFLTKQFENAQTEATGLIEKELKQTDFLLWIEACKNISSNMRHGSVIGRLSRIVDMGAVKPSFGKTGIQFGTSDSMFDGFKVVSNTKFLDKKDSKYRVKRDTSLGWASIKTTALYLKTTTATRHKDCYLADQHNGVFTSITPMEESEFDTQAANLIATKKLMFSKKATWVANNIIKRDLTIKLLEASKGMLDYDVIDVPDDYLSNLAKIEDGADVDAATGEAIIRISDADRRKLEAKVVYSTFVDRYMAYNTKDGETYQRAKREDKFENIKNYTGKLFYGSTEDMPKLQYACHLLDHDMSKNNTDTFKFHNDEYKIVLVAKNNVKHFKKDHSHIDDFFGKVELIKDEDGKVTGSHIVMDNAIVQWNTTRKISPHLSELSFMRNFSTFDEDVSADYEEVIDYSRRFNSNLSSYTGRLGMREHHNEFVKFLDSLETVQESVMKGDSAEDTASLVKEAGLPAGLTSGLAVNTAKLEQLEKLRGYGSTVRHLLNAIPALTDSRQDIPMELALEIGKYLDFKKVKYTTNK